jgi:crotonobetainyl-CoA:carnitine CoA-transferase CaiB-like acyl-CoA transferase
MRLRFGATTFGRRVVGVGTHVPLRQRGKRSITLDLTRDDGRALLRRLIEQSDVLVENYAVRVMEQFGLTWDVVHAWNPRLIMVRMPAFGLDGPWRDRVGFAQTMEQVSGMAWLSGYADTAPMNARGPCDPLAGLHAAFSALVGLHLRERTGLGTHVEATMVETALNAAAEQGHRVVGARSVVVTRRQPPPRRRAAGRLHRRRSPEARWARWHCVSKPTRKWRALVELIDDARLRDDRFADLDERLSARELFDEYSPRGARRAAPTRRCRHSCPPVCPPRPSSARAAATAIPQHDARGFFEPVEHAVIGTHRIGAFPVVFGRQPPSAFSRPAPRSASTTVRC